MNTVQLECFMAVAETLNFGRAAQQLSMTQPAVTHQINSLENELKVRLFRRTTRRVELTHEGRIFIDDARSILESIGIAVKRFNDPANAGVMLLNIGFSAFSAVSNFSEALADVRKEYANFYPKFYISPINQLFYMLSEERLDCVVNFEGSRYAAERFKFTPVRTCHICCVFPESSPFFGRDSVTLHELEELPLIVVDPVFLPVQVDDVQQALVKNRDLSQFYYCGSVEEALSLVDAGFGTAIVVDYLAAASGKKMTVITDTPSFDVGVYYKGFDRSPMIKPFVKAITVDKK